MTPEGDLQAHSKIRRSPKSRPTGARADLSRQRDLRELESQHRNLSETLSSLGYRLQKVTEEGTDEVGRAEVVRFFRSVTVLLREHFEYEEDGGYLAEALAAAPRLSKRAARLEAEHVGLYETLNALADCASVTSMASARWAELAERVRRFARAMARHELEENWLIHEAFTDDLGGGS